MSVLCAMCNSRPHHYIKKIWNLKLFPAFSCWGEEGNLLINGSHKLFTLSLLAWSNSRSVASSSLHSYHFYVIIRRLKKGGRLLFSSWRKKKKRQEERKYKVGVCVPSHHQRNDLKHGEGVAERKRTKKRKWATNKTQNISHVSYKNSPPCPNIYRERERKQSMTSSVKCSSSERNFGTFR